MLERAISCRQQCRPMCCLSDCHRAVLIKTAALIELVFFGTAKKELLSGHLRVGSDAAQRATALRMHCSSARVHEHAAMRSFADLLCTLVSVVCVLC